MNSGGKGGKPSVFSYRCIRALPTASPGDTWHWGADNVPFSRTQPRGGEGRAYRGNPWTNTAWGENEGCGMKEVPGMIL